MRDDVGWEDLRAQSARGQGRMIQRRVDKRGVVPLYRVIDPAEGLAVLRVDFAPEHAGRIRIPEVKGFSVLVQDGAPSGVPVRSVILRANAKADDEIFSAIAEDLSAVVDDAPSPRDAAVAIGHRIASWQRFLASGRDGVPTQDAAVGLLGELLVLDEIVAPSVGWPDALVAWGGPAGNVKDFYSWPIGIEVKTTRAANADFIQVAGLDQLDDTGLEFLFLVHNELSYSEGGVSLAGLVRSIADTLRDDFATASRFKAWVTSLGWSEEALNSDRGRAPWRVDTRTVYRVQAGFPRYVPADLKPGVRDFSYPITLQACAAFICKSDAIETELRKQAK